MPCDPEHVLCGQLMCDSGDFQNEEVDGLVTIYTVQSGFVQFLRFAELSTGGQQLTLSIQVWFQMESSMGMSP